MIAMDYSRLTKRIFLWYYDLENMIWNASVLKILSSINCKHIFNNMLNCDIKEIEAKLIQNYIVQLRITIN